MTDLSSSDMEDGTQHLTPDEIPVSAGQIYQILSRRAMEEPLIGEILTSAIWEARTRILAQEAQDGEVATTTEEDVEVGESSSDDV